MFDITDIKSFTEFQRNAKAEIARLKKTGRPAVLTVNGEAAVVVQDPKSYQRLLDLARRGEELVRLGEAIEQMDRGEVEPFEEVEERLRKKYDLPRRKRRSA